MPVYGQNLPPAALPSQAQRCRIRQNSETGRLTAENECQASADPFLDILRPGVKNPGFIAGLFDLVPNAWISGLQKKLADLGDRPEVRGNGSPTWVSPNWRGAMSYECHSLTWDKPHT
jgi:hypothetical protein